ncbi:uncharacterized protein LOC135834369 [Planococcus citri]|uniref:uncharacterized protein LOC135834369 n=1 Tax=Planococcus citri TaxID=170843 RepID=UPI0031F98083
MPYFKSFCGYSLKCGVYVSCAIHLLIGLCFAIASEERTSILLGFSQMWIVMNSVFALLLNSAFCLWLMIAYQFFIAACCGVAMVVCLIRHYIPMSFLAGLGFALEIYFVMLTINLHHEMKHRQTGHVFPDHPEASESNRMPQVNVQSPAAFNVPYVPVQSNLPNRVVMHSSIPQSAVYSASVIGVPVVDHHSYLPAHVQPAYNPDFVQTDFLKIEK